MLENQGKGIWQVQPEFVRGEGWSQLALQEDLCFEALEFSMPPVPDTPAPEQTAWYRGHTLSLHGVFIDVNPASGDSAIAALSREKCRKSCQLAVDLGASHVVFHCSCFPFLRGAYMSHWAAVCADFYQELAEQFPLHIWIENSQDVDPDPLFRLMGQLRHPGRVSVCLDLGHAHYSRQPLSAWFDKLGDFIGYLHLSDNHGLYDDHIPLGTGSVNWEDADRLWRCLGRETPITLETGGIRETEQSIRFLREHGYFTTH